MYSYENKDVARNTSSLWTIERLFWESYSPFLILRLLAFPVSCHLSWANYLGRFGCSEVSDLAQTLLFLLPL